MRISKDVKELAKEIHEAEHKFVDGTIDSKHKLEEYYYLLGALIWKDIKNEIGLVDIGLFNKIVDVQNEIRDFSKKISKDMKELSKQQKYLWQTLDDASKQNPEVKDE